MVLVAVVVPLRRAFHSLWEVVGRCRVPDIQVLAVARRFAPLADSTR
jgi:hypothetical protein